MQNLSIFQINNITTTIANRRHFILIHSKIFSIIGILLIPIVLTCLTISYYFYKRYLNTKFHQRIKRHDSIDNDQTSIIDHNSTIPIDENNSLTKHQEHQCIK
jgi:hypothetical protein